MCQRCKSQRIANIYAGCDDRFNLQIRDKEYRGYIPDELRLAVWRDALVFDICLDCGQVQGEWPIPLLELELNEAFTNKEK